MSSTDLDAPPLKLIFIAIIVVVGLHVLTAVALVAINTPEVKVELEKASPPIEIEMVVPPPPAVEIEKVNPEEEPESVRETKPKAQPVAAAKPKAVQKPEPIEKTKPVEKPKSSKLTPPPEKQDVAPKTSPDTTSADEQRRVLLAKAKQARIDERLAAQAQAQADADVKAAQVKADADAKKAQEIARANAKAEKDRLEVEARANAKKIAEEEAAAKRKSNTANKQPANFEITPAHWLVTPDFRTLNMADYSFKSNRVSVVMSMSINANGSISNIKIIKSSGDYSFDRALKRALSKGKLKPFDKNGTSIEGTAMLPLDYNIN